MYIKWIFLPLLGLYYLVTELRNWLFQKKILKSFPLHLFSIGVSNLQIGGTGKTPHIAYLITLFQDFEKVVISRGYGRKSKGFIHVTAKSKLHQVGDEMFMLYKRHYNRTRFYVGEDRKNAFLRAANSNENSIFLFDDCMQHQYIKPSVQLLLTPFPELFINDQLLPIGRLREAKKNANRANAIIITNSPVELDEVEKKSIKEKIARYCTNNQPIFFSSVFYQSPKSYANQLFDLKKTSVLICGIGRPDFFVGYCEKTFLVIQKILFADHQSYSRRQIDQIIQKYSGVQFITTEKDFVKISELLDEVEKKSFFYIPIEIRMHEKEAFDRFLTESWSNFNSILLKT